MGIRRTIAKYGFMVLTAAALTACRSPRMGIDLPWTPKEKPKEHLPLLDGVPSYMRSLKPVAPEGVPIYGRGPITNTESSEVSRNNSQPKRTLISEI